MDTSTLVIAALLTLFYIYSRYKRHAKREQAPHNEAARPSPAPERSGAEREEKQDPESFIAAIPNYNELHTEMVKRNFGVELSHDEASFAQLDEIIEEGWSGNPPMMGNTIIMFGSFAGESIRHLLGGHWAYDEEMGYHLAGLGGTSTKVFPFGKVEKRFLNGEEDSLAAYYAAVKQIVQQERKGEQSQ